MNLKNRLTSVQNSCGAKKEIFWKQGFTNDPVFDNDVIGKTFDVVVVGGGVQGLSAAKILVERGLSVAIVDKGHIGGNSAVSGGIISADNERDLSEWVDDLGEENARKLLDITSESAVEFLDFIAKQNIETPEHNGVIVAAAEKSDLAALQREIDLHAKFNVPLTALNQTDLRRKISSSFIAGYHSPHASAINPYRAFRNFASYLRSKGVLCAEHLEILSINADKKIMKTSSGEIEYRAAIVTAGVGIGTFTQTIKHALPFTPLLAVTKPLSAEDRVAIGWNNREVLWGLGAPFSYFRMLDDGRIMYGPGRHERFGNITSNTAYHMAVARKAEKELADIFPITPEVEYVWSGTMYVTEDELPDFGISKSGLVYYGAGASLALGFWIGKQLAALALGEDLKDPRFFSEIRKHRRGSYNLLFHAPLPRSLKIAAANIFIALGL